MSNICIDIEWTEDSKREALPCVECKTPTKGREHKKAICMQCVFAVIFGKVNRVQA